MTYTYADRQFDELHQHLGDVADLTVRWSELSDRQKAFVNEHINRLASGDHRDADDLGSRIQGSREQVEL